jgi:hypothetical protein
MKLRLRCSNCRASFEVAGDPLPEVAACPECGKSHRLPALGDRSQPEDAPVDEGVSVFVPSGQPPIKPERPRRWGLYTAVALCLLLVAGVLASWPWLKERFWKPSPQDPVELVARSYLEALAGEDSEQAHRLGTVEVPPAIRSFGEVTRVKEHDQTLRGKFGPIARLNKQIDEKFSFDPKINRFTPKNPLGAAGETLDALHDAKEKAEKSGIYEKMASGDPNDVFDAAENFGKVFSQLAEGALAPKRILPTYPMLVKDAKPPLPDTEKVLALDYGENHETWDALLKRPFLTLKADGPYILDRAEVLATVHDKLASLGDPPSTLRLKLVRFRLEGIDTGWKVVSAQRMSDEAQVEDSAHEDSAKTKETDSRDHGSHPQESLGDRAPRVP